MRRKRQFGLFEYKADGLYRVSDAFRIVGTEAKAIRLATAMLKEEKREIVVIPIVLSDN